MCGIVGVVGQSNCQGEILDNLKKLQYRGYDSAGICVKSKGQLFIHKSKGTIDMLEQKCHDLPEAQIGIGHTRWATHGAVCEKNAHPIEGGNRLWAVVHNGIIENYQEIACDLAKENVKLKTDTDTEVIAAMLALNNFLDPIKNICFLSRHLKGSFAFCALKKEGEKALYAAKNKSPLYAYSSPEKCMIASDPVCFPKGKYFKLEDGEMAKVTKNGITFYDELGNVIEKTPLKELDFEQTPSKGEFEHYMLKEIYETPTALKRLVSTYQQLDFNALRKIKFSKVKLIGCGTAYHACLMGARFFKKHLKIDAEAVTASEFRYEVNVISRSTLCIFVSQSGETADTIAALQLAQKKRAKIISLTNVSHSTLASLSENSLPICAGPEIAVASTKAYSAQVAALYVLVNMLKSDERGLSALKNVQTLAKKLEKFFVNTSHFAEDLSKAGNIFFIGRGSDYVTALEGALKLKEISYINCNAFPAGELKHGVLTLVEKGTPIVVIATDKNVASKTMNSALEARSRGAKLYLICSEVPKECEFEKFELCLSLPRSNQELKCILAIVPLQLVAYSVALFRGNDPDKPRNLAKSVTVE